MFIFIFLWERDLGVATLHCASFVKSLQNVLWCNNADFSWSKFWRGHVPSRGAF